MTKLIVISECLKRLSEKFTLKKNQALIALISTKILNMVRQLLESILVINFEDVCALNTVKSILHFCSSILLKYGVF